MAADVLAPVLSCVSGAIGVFFTWLAGAQGRASTERMMKSTRQAERRTYLLRERRAAYFEALRVVEFDLHVARYRAHGRNEKLQALEQHWPDARRIELTMNAQVTTNMFGSQEVRQLASQWTTAVRSGELPQLEHLADRLREQIRIELQALE